MTTTIYVKYGFWSYSSNRRESERVVLGTAKLTFDTIEEYYKSVDALRSAALNFVSRDVLNGREEKIGVWPT
ncbi:MAG: hypothetical protein AB1753_06885 [Thermoproteota archaeon]